MRGKSRLIDTVARSVPIVRCPAAEVAETVGVAAQCSAVLSQDMGHRAGLPTPMAATLDMAAAGTRRRLAPARCGGRGEPADPHPGGRDRDPAGSKALPIAVDDLQWCDPSSLAVLEAVVRRDATTGTVVAFRSEEVADHTEVADFRGGPMWRCGGSGQPVGRVAARRRR